jgi:hypothetical protein
MPRELFGKKLKLGTNYTFSDKKSADLTDDLRFTARGEIGGIHDIFVLVFLAFFGIFVIFGIF